MFSRFLGPEFVLVPIPSSSLQQQGSLWVPEELARSLVEVGLGARVARLLKRTEAIPKAATSISTQRPTALKHYETLAVQKELLSTKEFLLVDDVITSGAAMVGSANRLQESYPGSTIRGFAAMRTVSQALSFKSWNDPVVGTITLESSGWCMRHP
jgi:predicted amidophosphoribosyltransferase